MNVKKMSLIAVMTAVMCILGPMSVPIGPVPFSFTVLTVYLAVYILGMKEGTLSCLLYLLLGLAGLPVFSGYAGGPAKLFGPTGGYLIGFLLMALISGWFIERFSEKLWMQVLGMAAGLLLCYTLGTVWLSTATGMGLQKALAVGVLPFIPLDLLKLAISVALGRAVRSRLSLFSGSRAAA